MKSALTVRAQKNFQSGLLKWFRAHQRDLPWRASRDPYRIWVAEVMLQQTRIAAVMPYYQRFLDRFPKSRIARKRSANRSPETLVRPRLLQPRPQSARLRERNRRSPQRKISARSQRRSSSPRHRRLHRRRSPEHRVRCPACRARWQRRTRPGPHPCHPRRPARPQDLAHSHRNRESRCSPKIPPATGTNPSWNWAK